MSAEDTFNKLKHFIEEHPVCKKGTGPVKNGVEVEIHIKGDPKVYTFRKVDGSARLLEETPKKPDFRLDFPPAVIDELVESESDDVGWYGVRIFEHSVAKDPEAKVDAKIYVGFLTLMKHGYFGMLRVGGRVLVQLLKTHELHKPSNMKRVVQKLRSN